MNNRLRAISRFIPFTSDDWEYYHYPRQKIPCPCCFNPLQYHTWSEELGMVEYIYRCRSCGYKDHWYYGRNEYVVGKECFEFPDSVTEKEHSSILDKVANAIKRYRAKWKHENSLYFKKKKYQNKRRR